MKKPYCLDNSFNASVHQNYRKLLMSDLEVVLSKFDGTLGPEDKFFVLSMLRHKVEEGKL